MALADLEQRTGATPREPPLELPVIQEALDVRTRRVETGRVRITQVILAREELIDEPLVQEEVTIELRLINRVVDGPVPIRYDGDTMIFSLLEEVLVVDTRLLLKEEVHISKRRTETHPPVPVTGRREAVAIARVDRARYAPHNP